MIKKWISLILFSFCLSFLFSHTAKAEKIYTFSYYIVKDDNNIYGIKDLQTTFDHMIGPAPVALLLNKNKVLTANVTTGHLFDGTTDLGAYPNIVSPHTLQTITPTTGAYYIKSNGKMYAVSEGWSFLISNSPTNLMKEQTYYVRVPFAGLTHYYEYYGDFFVYAFTYDAPYTLMNLNQKSGLSGADYDRLIQNVVPDSPLIGWGDSFKKAEDEYGINGLYLLAHAIHESGWGKSNIATGKNNLFGWHAYDWDPYNNAGRFSSFEDSILYVAKYVKENYLTLGGSYYRGPNLKGMNVFYATDPLWADKIASIMERFKPYDHYGSFVKSSIDGNLYLRKMDHDYYVAPGISTIPLYTFFTFHNNTPLKDDQTKYLSTLPTRYDFMTNEANFFQNASSSTLSYGQLRNNGTAVNVYTNSNLALIKTTIPGDAIFAIRGQENNFVKIELQDKTLGWISKTDLQ